MPVVGLFMAIRHDFTCMRGHLFERAVESSRLTNQRCPMCRSKCEVTYLPKRAARTPNTVYYENARGERLYPWDANDLPKAYTDKGFQRMEVSTFERHRFERRVRAEMNAEHAARTRESTAEYEAARSAHHADLRQQMQSWGEFERDVARVAMEEESRGYSRNFDCEFHIGPE